MLAAWARAGGRSVGSPYKRRGWVRSDGVIVVGNVFKKKKATNTPAITATKPRRQAKKGTANQPCSTSLWEKTANAEP